MKLLDESILEPFLRYIRFKSALKLIDKDIPITLVDLGCGPKIRFFHYLKKNKIKIKKYYGIDPLITDKIVQEQINNSKIEFLKYSLDHKINIKNLSVDYVIGLAFLEHINKPAEIIRESVRILKKNGKAIWTTPTYKAKPILEFLSYKLKIISKREIQEHKEYYTKESIIKILPKKYKIKFEHKYFEFGMNNVFVITKLDK